MQAERSTWQVLLIGGSSGVGKSVASQELAKLLQISHMLVDDVRMAIQAVTSPAQLPSLHYFVTKDNLAALPAEAFIDGLIAVGRALTPALCAVINHHIIVPAVGRLILEGDGILPEIVAPNRRSIMLNEWSANVRVVFLYEPDEAYLLRNFIDRDRGFNASATDEQRNYVHTIWQYGAWLKTEAERYNVPVLPARPYATVAQRILAAARLTSAGV